MDLTDRAQHLRRTRIAKVLILAKVLVMSMALLVSLGNSLVPSYADPGLRYLGLSSTKHLAVEAGAPDTYRFKAPHSRIMVHLLSSRDPDAASVVWTEKGERRKEFLSFPGGWWPTTRDENDTPKPLPSAILWRVDQQDFLVIIGQRDSGVYGYRCPMIYRLGAKHWQIIPDRTKSLQFSNRGCFYLQGRRLYVWDYVADETLSHGAPQRYWLREFVLRHGRLTLWKRRVTRGRYEDIRGLDDASGSIPSAFDPLPEWGLRWHWWRQPGK